MSEKITKEEKLRNAIKHYLIREGLKSVESDGLMQYIYTDDIINLGTTDAGKDDEYELSVDIKVKTNEICKYIRKKHDQVHFPYRVYESSKYSTECLIKILENNSFEDFVHFIDVEDDDLVEEVYKKCIDKYKNI